MTAGKIYNKHATQAELKTIESLTKTTTTTLQLKIETG